jgi:GYF domain 2
MNYTVIRDGKEFGPYSLADLQKYVASGNIVATDLARSEGMAEAIPVGQIIGNISVPVTSAPLAQAPGWAGYPDPPNLPWWLVLILTIFTCGIFLIVWDIVLAVWTKKVQPTSRAIYYYSGVVVLYLVVIASAFVAGMNIQHAHSGGLGATANPMAGLANLGIAVLSIIGRFSMRNSLEDHFTRTEQIPLALSGVMTFFFGSIYFQYHLNEIMRRRSMPWLGQRPA